MTKESRRQQMTEFIKSYPRPEGSNHAYMEHTVTAAMPIEFIMEELDPIVAALLNIAREGGRPKITILISTRDYVEPADELEPTASEIIETTERRRLKDGFDSIIKSQFDADSQAG